MRSKVKQPKPSNGNGTQPDIEELAAKARDERIERCRQAIEKALEEHKCQIAPTFKIGEQLVPTGQIINFPVVVNISSR